MCQYTKLFGTARIPMPARDKTVFCEDSRHIVVMSRGLIYAFDVFDENMELSISRDRLAETLRAITVPDKTSKSARDAFASGWVKYFGMPELLIRHGPRFPRFM